MKAFIEDTLREAGRMALALASNAKGERKADRSLVSDADRQVETYITKRITERFPDDRIIGEEHGATFTAEIDGQRLWAIDPIDGTNPFLNGLPTWGVCIGAMEKGEPTAGGMFLPRLDEMLLAVRGEGAVQNGAPLPQLQPMEIDNQTVLLSPSSRKRFYKMNFPGKSMAYGSIAAHVAFAATGSGIGALVDRPYIWDILGPLAVLMEVGGGAFYPDGRPLDLRSLAAGQKEENPLFFGLAENTEKLYPMLEIIPRPKK
ncbi:MAG: inositol monophosphatase family protein [Nitrospinota bacterium]